jgi:hypothetical protein
VIPHEIRRGTGQTVDPADLQWRRRIRKTHWIIVGVMTLIAGGAFAYLRWYGMPLGAWYALNNADRYELLSLHPYLSEPEYYGHEILGQTVVADVTMRDRLNEALQAGVRGSEGRVKSCFNPRHGIRVTHDGVTTDFVICFECRQVQVWRGNQQIAFFLVSDSPQTVFDEVLKSAGVPLAPKEP